MMYQQVIARRYAKGLMLAAKDQELERVQDSLLPIVELIKDDSLDFSRLFRDPSFSVLERKAVMTRVVEEYDMCPVLRFFLLLLVDKNRVILLPLIYEWLVALVDERRGRVRAEIMSATPIGEQVVNDIKTALRQVSKKQVEAVVSVDPDLLGGIRVKMGGMVFDGSLRAKLLALKNGLRYEVGGIENF